MKKIFTAALLLLASISAFAQFSPGQILTAAALNGQFALYAPLGGATFTGPVTIPTLSVTGSISLSSPLPVALGGTGQATAVAAAHALNLGTTDTPTFYGVTINGSTQHGLIVGGGNGNPFTYTATGSAGQPLLSGGAAADPSFGTLGANYGGTGLTSLTQYSTLVGNGTGAVSLISPNTANYAYLSNGPSANPSFQQLTAPVVNYNQGATGAVTRALSLKLQESVSVLDFAGADPTGATDSSTAINSALTALASSGGTLLVPPGTYTVNSDLLYYSNLTFYVARGATMNFNGSRFTPANASVVNVSLIVDGAMNSSNLSTNAPQKFSWPSDTGSGHTTYERGFVEFGGASGTSRSPGFFYVGGHGTITGDFTGTPSTANLWTGDLCRKGIATFFSDNVLVEDVNVSGFHGEAVYHYDSTSPVTNVVFQHTYVHDTNFNALNFNNLSEAKNSYIRDNTTYNSYQGIEISAGSAINNTVRLTQGPGILTGAGTVQTVSILNNTVDSAQADGIDANSYSGNTGTGVIDVIGNIISNSQGNGIVSNYLNSLEVRGNIISGYATTAASYGVYVGSGVSYGNVSWNKITAPNAGATAPIRNAATYPTSTNNLYYDTTTNAPVLASTAGYLASTQTNEYRVIDGIGAAGVGNSIIYKIGSGLPLAAQQNYAKTYSSVDATGSTGASGSYHIATKKTSTESTTLSDTAVFDQNGNVLVTSAGGLGYGVGSGGTVTQATSKSTAVTLNTPTGQITTANSALAAGATATFTLNDSVMSANDVLVVSINANSPNASSYSVSGLASSTGTIFLKNTSAGSLSDAVVINFAVIKGSAS